MAWITSSYTGEKGTVVMRGAHHNNNSVHVSREPMARWGGSRRHPRHPPPPQQQRPRGVDDLEVAKYDRHLRADHQQYEHDQREEAEDVVEALRSVEAVSIRLSMSAAVSRSG